MNMNRLFELLQDAVLAGHEPELIVNFWVVQYRKVLKGEGNRKLFLLKLRELRHDLKLLGVHFVELDLLLNTVIRKF
jgi:hypothetical protein